MVVPGYLTKTVTLAEANIIAEAPTISIIENQLRKPMSMCKDVKCDKQNIFERDGTIVNELLPIPCFLLDRMSSSLKNRTTYSTSYFSQEGCTKFYASC